MRTFGSILILSVIITASVFLIGFSGCSESLISSGTGKRYKARSEKEFVLNANLKAEPGAVLIINLEHLSSSPADSIPDSGTIGEDIIPISYTETAEHKIRIGDSSDFSVKLISDAGAVIYELTPASNSVTVNIPAGNYKLHLTSLVTFRSGAYGAQTVFVQPDKSYTSLSTTDYDPDQVQTLIKTNSCPNCDLSEAAIDQAFLAYANLYNANLTDVVITYSFLSSADLRYANLTNAHMFYTDFGGTKMNHATLYNATFHHSNCPGANLDSANLTYVHFVGKPDLFPLSLRGANLFHADMGGADLQFTDFTGTDASGANFRNTDLSYARMTGANFFGAPFDNAKLVHTVSINSNFNKAEFRNAHLDMSGFRNSKFHQTIFNNVTCEGTDFCGSDFEGVDQSDVTVNAQTKCWPY